MNVSEKILSGEPWRFSSKRGVCVSAQREYTQKEMLTLHMEVAKERIVVSAVSDVYRLFGIKDGETPSAFEERMRTKHFEEFKTEFMESK